MKRLLTPLNRLWLPAAGLVIAICAAAPVGAEIIERIVVKVNGEIFTKSQLEKRQVATLREQGQNQQVSDAELKKRLEALTPQVLVDAIDEMLLMQRGKELGYSMGDAQYEETLTKIKTENHIESDEQFQAALKQENLTPVDLRRMLERSYIIQRVEQAEVFGRISVSEAEERKYYEQHPNEFTLPATVTLREILVKVPTDGKNVNVAADEAAKQKADSIRERAAKGESFEKLAAESDTPSKASGGLIPPINRADLNPTFAKMLADMKVGDISPVMRTAAGYDIVKLEAVSEAKLRPFEETRSDIANKVGNSKSQAQLDAYMKKLRASAIIDWKVPELKKLYDEQIARGSNPVGGGSQ